MSERLVRLGHAVRVVLLLDRRALVARGRKQLGGESISHRLLTARAGVLDQPPHPQRLPPLGPHLYRHLVGGATDTTRLHLQHRLRIVERLTEDTFARLPRTLLDRLHGVVEDALGDGLLSVLHQVVHELRDRLGSEYRIGLNRALNGPCAAAHRLLTLSLCGGTTRLRLLRSILRTTLTTIVHPRGVQRAADDVVPHTRQVLHTTTTDQHGRVLLEVVPLTR